MAQRLIAGSKNSLIPTEKETYRIPFFFFDLVTRFDVPPIITSSVAPMTTFGNMVILDRFVSPSVVLEQGFYDIYMLCTTNDRSGTVVFDLNYEQIIGSVDFYSPITNVTLKKIEGIEIPISKKIFVSGIVDTTNPSSTGYDVIISELVFIKYD
jgi:hypothetical protein